MSANSRDIDPREDFFRSLEIRTTDHAIDRIKERFGLPRSAVLKLANDAKNHGDCYVRARIEDGDESISFIHKDKVFIFSECDDFFKKNNKVLALVTAHGTGPSKLADKTHVHTKGKKEIVYRKDSMKTKHQIRNQHRKSNKHKSSYYHEEPQG